MAAPLLTDGLIDDKGRVLARDKHPLGRSLRDLNYLICELGFVNFRAHTEAAPGMPTCIQNWPAPVFLATQLLSKAKRPDQF